MHVYAQLHDSTTQVYCSQSPLSTGAYAVQCQNIYDAHYYSLGARPSHTGGGGSGKLAYINSLWDMAFLQASYAKVLVVTVAACQ